ncbi:hypothetical protein RISK_002844 [Rhodopirellula islandica]|uniref:Uncharacterized protein n=1 Tax=Rhodopirellula islandica TaxID=595434 RepID=A0A0J1BER6_RHOIS|nr:hypothetical protein [Rhodopirellula islandica]KLU05082.1 hypothetical protein RISK_002844 [Rhodopirellula islandica]
MACHDGSLGRDVSPADEEGGEVDQPDLLCEHCGSDRLELVAQTEKPSWKELMWRESDSCPWWYADRQRESHRKFWTESHGKDFYDWYLQTQVEGAKEREQDRPPAFQLSLPGLAASRACQERIW